MEFALLGPLLVRRSARTVPIPPGRQRILLAALLLDANRVVPTARLADALWGDQLPPSERASLHNYVKRLRRSLEDAGHSLISTHPGGYLISVSPDELDLSRFEALLAGAREATQAGSWDKAARRLGSALSLWRGEPLADIPSDALILREAPRLAELRQQAIEARIDADLHLGRAAAVIGELRGLVAAHPLRERLHALLMLALYLDGQQAEALNAYQHARRVLADELGAEPCPELRKLQHQILIADPALALPPSGDAPAAPGAGPVRAHGPAAPRQLPAAIPQFAGRAAELAALNSLLGDTAPAGPVVVSAIGGTAGVGKTALAIRWAHQVAGRFPDGQLYASLHGFGPSAAPADPAAVIRGFLGALGVNPERVPADPDAQAALFRSLLAGRRILVILDNARDEHQVRPMLPGSPGCLTLVTSRHQLTGLIATEGARPIVLDVLTEPDARELLCSRLGAERIAAEPGAVTELTGLCARLPLALAIAAARAAIRPGFALAELAAELRDAGARLDVLDAGEPAASVRAVFSWSYQALSPAAARIFRLLGVHPGPDISLPAAASLAGLTPPRARILLDELTAMHLLTEPVPGRFAFHDLLRAYATEQADSLDNEAVRRAAIHRVLDHYLHTAYAADRILNSSRTPLPMAQCQPGAILERLVTGEHAATWFEAEHQVLRAAISLATASGFHEHAWQIPWTLVDFFDRQGDLHGWLVTQRAALHAARRARDSFGQACVHRALGRVYTLFGSYEKSHTHLNRGLRLHAALGDLAGQADAHHALGHLSTLQGRCEEHLDHERQALDLYRALGDRVGQANALNAIAYGHSQLGKHRDALEYGQQALELHRQLGYRFGQAQVWDTLGSVRQDLGDHAEAVVCYQQALELCRELGSRHYQSVTLSHLGDCYQALGEAEAAVHAWRQALNILDDLDHPSAGQVRAKLDTLDAHAGQAGADNPRERARTSASSG